ncbi:hypothetical protein [Streptomyces sp. NPDC060275]|uniref:hypothetical protein n=1 Tax=Streptomyces sp. NPDC060275 TaxID=3347090 RepID=UPI0036DC225D
MLLAALADRVAVAEVLVADGADVPAQDVRDGSAWLVTGVTGSVAMMRALLPGGPDVTPANRFGGVAVIPASERGHMAYVRAVLAETDSDVDHVNRGRTAQAVDRAAPGVAGRTAGRSSRQPPACTRRERRTAAGPAAVPDRRAGRGAERFPRRPSAVTARKEPER